jgi:hypothetical protein
MKFNLKFLFIYIGLLCGPIFSSQNSTTNALNTKSIQKTSWTNEIYSTSYDNLSSNHYGISTTTHVINNIYYIETKEQVYYMDLDFSSLPSDAYNISAEMSIYKTSGSSGAKVVLLPDNTSSTNSLAFAAVKAGSELFSVDDEEIGYNHDLSSKVVSRLSGGHLKLGVRRSGSISGRVDVEVLLKWDAPSHITARNNFIYGSINVGVNESPSPESSPHNFSANVGSSVVLEAVDQTYDTYDRIWNDTEAPIAQSSWNIYKNGSWSPNGTSPTKTFNVDISDNGGIYEAGLRKKCNLTFTNNTGLGTIKVDGLLKTSLPFSTTEIEKNDITGLAINHFSNGIEFTFSSWSPGGSTTYETTFAPEVHTNYVANFTGRPTNTYRNQYFNPKVVGQPIKVYWSQHPSTNVTQYKIYRKPKIGSETCIGTVSRTGDSSYTYTFTDPDMVHTNSSSTYNLYYYDVRAYYSPDGNYSDYDFKAVYAEMGGPIADDNPNEERMQIAEKTYEYGISNYPNPYNPTTTINYQIKEMGNVNITVFDALGRTVKVLVNDIKQPGDYNILFDGSNLSNGVYYYRMQSGKFVETKKMIMMK